MAMALEQQTAARAATHAAATATAAAALRAHEGVGEAEAEGGGEAEGEGGALQTPRAAAAGRPPPGCTPATMCHEADELGLVGGQSAAQLMPPPRSHLAEAAGGGGGGGGGSLSLLSVGGHAPPATPAVSLLGGLTSEADLMVLAQQQAG